MTPYYTDMEKIEESKRPLIVRTKLSDLEKERMQNHLSAKGIKQGWFIRQAILEKLEREEVGLELSRKEEKPKC